MNEQVSSKTQEWLTPGTWLVGTSPSSGHLQSQATGPRLRRPDPQVLLTGKPCRNFQVLVAYSMLQMVREQVLQESMGGDDILLVRALSGKPPAQLLEALTPHPSCKTGAHGVLGTRATFSPQAGRAMRAKVRITVPRAFNRLAHLSLTTSLTQRGYNHRHHS